MASHWQDLIALAIVALAAAYLARTLARLFQPGRSGCASGCGKCGSHSRTLVTFPTPPDVLSISPPSRREG